MTQLSRFFWSHLRAAVPDITLNGPTQNRLPNTLNVSFLGIDAPLLVARLDLAGVACSAGSACSSGSLQPSPTLHAMHLPDARLRSAVRFSLGRTNNADDIKQAATRIAQAVRELRQSKSTHKLADAAEQQPYDQPPTRAPSVLLYRNEQVC